MYNPVCDQKINNKTIHDLDFWRSKLTVLVVDSDADSRELMYIFLEMHQINPVVVATAREALFALKRTQPNLLISEIGLPGEDGYSLIKKVKRIETERGIAIPAIALTAYVMKEDRERALAAGFCKHIPKPCDLDELALAVFNLSNHH